VALMSWFVARTEPQRERTAQHFLELAKFTVYIPVIRERQVKGGRRIVRLRSLFPSYVFIAFENGRWWDARWTIGVSAVIMTDGVPAQLGDHVINEIKGRERGGAVELPRREMFRAGDRVRITAGVFNGHLGLFQGQLPRERIAILLSWLGTQRRVELPKDSIEAVS
jgi:transcriptional antiterminator RfaH